jgi:hypothetical protein
MSDLQIDHSVSRHTVNGIQMGDALEALRATAPLPNEPPSGQAGMGITAAIAGPGVAVVVSVSSPALLCGLEALARSIPGVAFGGAATRLNALLQHCARAGECVALVDPFIGGGDVRSFMVSLKGAAPRARPVLITDANQPQIVREAVKAGARGFVGTSAEMAGRDSRRAVGCRGRQPLFRASDCGPLGRIAFVRRPDAPRDASAGTARKRFVQQDHCARPGCCGWYDQDPRLRDPVQARRAVPNRGCAECMPPGPGSTRLILPL